MSNAAINWAVKLREVRRQGKEPHRLTRGEKQILFLLANMADEKRGMTCWPSVATLVAASAMSESSVHRTLASLVALGLISRDGKGRGGRGVSATTTLIMDEAETVPPAAPNRPAERVPESTERVPSETERVPKSAETVSPAAPEPLRTTIEPQEPLLSSPESSDRFETEFWPAYPRKTGKADARKAWRAAIKARFAPASIVEAVRRYPWNPDPRFVMEAGRWIRERRWEDQHPPSRPAEAFDPTGRVVPLSQHRGRRSPLAEAMERLGVKPGTPLPGDPEDPPPRARWPVANGEIIDGVAEVVA
jgi:DNA-binding MarR family transcriptional regulator